MKNGATTQITLVIPTFRCIPNPGLMPLLLILKNGKKMNLSSMPDLGPVSPLARVLPAVGAAAADCPAASVVGVRLGVEEKLQCAHQSNSGRCLLSVSRKMGWKFCRNLLTDAPSSLAVVAARHPLLPPVADAVSIVAAVGHKLVHHTRRALQTVVCKVWRQGNMQGYCRSMYNFSLYMSLMRRLKPYPLNFT